MWRIYYADGAVVEGDEELAWREVPSDGVQVVVRFPQLLGLRWRGQGGPVRDRDLWTGKDEYDPFGWGAKRGSLIDDEVYQAIWERACGNSNP